MRLSLHVLSSPDGVMQGPGGPGKDRDGDFGHGGWSVPYDDEDMGVMVSGWLAGAGAFLFGRKTYEIFRAQSCSLWCKPGSVTHSGYYAGLSSGRPDCMSRTALRTLATA
jgi:dihydrofolate reductase